MTDEKQNNWKPIDEIYESDREPISDCECGDFLMSDAITITITE